MTPEAHLVQHSHRSNATQRGNSVKPSWVTKQRSRFQGCAVLRGLEAELEEALDVWARANANMHQACTALTLVSRDADHLDYQSPLGQQYSQAMQIRDQQWARLREVKTSCRQALASYLANGFAKLMAQGLEGCSWTQCSDQIKNLHVLGQDVDSRSQARVEQLAARLLLAHRSSLELLLDARHQSADFLINNQGVRIYHHPPG